MTAGWRVRRRRRAVCGVLLATVVLIPLVRAASADQFVVRGRSMRRLGGSRSAPALPPTRPGTAPSGAAGPPPLGAAGPSPLGAAGPPPLGAAGPPPLGAAGSAPLGVTAGAPRVIVRAAPRPGSEPRCAGEGCADAAMRDSEGLPFDGADDQPMDAAPRD